MRFISVCVRVSLVSQQPGTRLWLPLCLCVLCVLSLRIVSTECVRVIRVCAYVIGVPTTRNAALDKARSLCIFIGLFYRSLLYVSFIGFFSRYPNNSERSFGYRLFSRLCHTYVSCFPKRDLQKRPTKNKRPTKRERHDKYVSLTDVSCLCVVSLSLTGLFRFISLFYRSLFKETPHMCLGETRQIRVSHVCVVSLCRVSLRHVRVVSL